MRNPFRTVVSYAAGFFPNTMFCGSELRTRMNGILDKEKSTTEGQKMCGLSKVAMMMSVAVSERLDVGDEFRAVIDGVTDKGRECGSYTVTVKRNA